MINIEQPEDIAKVYVIDSVKEELRGRIIRVMTKSMKEVPEQGSSEAAHIQLIDLAILIKDEEWFTQLSKQLYQIRK